MKVRTILLVAAGLWVVDNQHLRAAELNVSLIHSLTGPYAFAGVDAAKASQLGIEELNASGRLGSNTLKLNSYDDGSDRSQTLVLINRSVINDNALLILGPTGSVQAVVAGAAANDLKIPLLTNANTAEVLKPGPWTFKVTASPPDPIIPLARYAVDKLHAKRAALVYQRDNEGMVSFAKVFRDYMSAHGVELVADQTLVAADSDFVALSTKLAEAKPDILYLGASSAQAANVVLQAKQAGVASDIKILGPAGLGVDYVKVGGRAVENTFFYADYDPDAATPLNQAFVEHFRKRFNDAPTNWAGLGYSAAMIAGTAIEAAGPNPTRESVRAALAGLHDVPVVMGSGTWGMDANRNPRYDIRVMTIKDGHFVSAP